MDNQLDNVRARVKRAYSRIAKLERREMKVETSGLTIESVGYYDDIVVRYWKPVDKLRYLSFHISEAVHFARSALDHAVWELVPEDKRHIRTSFPVLLSKEKFEKNRKVIDGLSDKAVKLVEKFQPYNNGLESNPLHLLNQLWNIDKHRQLNACVTFPEGGVLKGTQTKIGKGKSLERAARSTKTLKKNFRFKIKGPLIDGAEVFRLKRQDQLRIEILEVSVFELEFEDGPMRGQPLIEGLRSLVSHAEEIIEALASTVPKKRR